MNCIIILIVYDNIVALCNIEWCGGLFLRGHARGMDGKLHYLQMVNISYYLFAAIRTSRGQHLTHRHDGGVRERCYDVPGMVRIRETIFMTAQYGATPACNVNALVGGARILLTFGSRIWEMS